MRHSSDIGTEILLHFYKNKSNFKKKKHKIQKKNRNVKGEKERLKKKTILMIAIILIGIMFILTVIKPQNVILKKIYRLEYSNYVYQYAEENSLDPFLVFAIIKAESNFKRNIESSSGAIGLMQLMESTAVEMANEIGEEIIVKEALFNPETNIKIGTNYFSYLLKHYEGNEGLALTAYNAGMGNVDKWIEEGIIKEDGSNLEQIPYKETNNYVRKIVRDYKIYQELYK